MSKHDQELIRELRAQVKIAKEALTKIRFGCADADGVAEDALDRMWPHDDKQPLQGVVGHGTRRR